MADTPPGQARNLVLDPKGFWISRQSQALSYPEEGNSLCFAVEDDSFWFGHRNNVIVSVMRQFPPAGPVFDVGGGNGFVSSALQRAGLDTVLIEPGRAGAENACRRGLKDVICATTDTADFPPGTMHAIGLFDVLEHIEHDEVFLQSMSNLLQPGGRIYLTVPAFNFLWSMEDQFAGHFRRYTRKSLRNVLERAGFEVEYTTCFFWFLPVPVWLFRSVPSWLGRRGKPSTESARKEHTANQGLAGKMVDLALTRELAWLRRGNTLPLGGSCLAVARKSADRSNSR